MARQDGRDNLKHWKPGESGNPAGRPKKIIKRLEEAVGIKFNLELTKTDKYQIIEWCLERNLKELKDLVNDPQSPIFLVNIATAIIGDIKKGQLKTVELIFDRVFGKPDQRTNVKLEGEITFADWVKRDESGRTDNKQLPE